MLRSSETLTTTEVDTTFSELTAPLETTEGTVATSGLSAVMLEAQAAANEQRALVESAEPAGGFVDLNLQASAFQSN
jgi:hypothetical protein